MNNIIRTPRPLGSTELSKAYNATNDEEHYQSLKQNIIHHYIRNNFSYCGQYMNIEQFAFLIKETPITIQRYMGTYGDQISTLVDEMTKANVFRALGKIAFFNCIEDRSLALQQLSIMTESQGGTYAPFISGEVNKSIKLVMDSNAQMITLMQRFQGSPGRGFSPFDELQPGNENAPVEKGITIDDAVILLKENNVTPLLANEAQKENLYIEYNIENMPEVNALRQLGADTSKEGLTLGKIDNVDDGIYTDIKEKGLSKTKHRLRREQELEIDDDDDSI